MKVVVAGGGVIGLSVAWQAARHGHEVVLADPDPGRGTSWAGAGMLAPVAEAYFGEEAITAFGMAASHRWESWADELRADAGSDPGYTRKGTLVIARDHDELAALVPLHEMQLAQQLRAERVSAREARRIEPALAPAICGGLWLADDHQVDNRLYVRALIDACGRAGVSFVHERAATCAPTHVTLDGGIDMAADAVVVATGTWQPVIEAGGEQIDLYLRPVKGQIIRVRSTNRAVFPTRTVRSGPIYVVPRDHGELAIGATAEERGFDTTVTAGAARELLTKSWELLPGLAEAELVEVMAGLRPGTPDNAPMIGRLPGGPILAMGHFRHGILFSPATAAAVVAMIDGGEVPEVVAPFTPERFAGATTARRQAKART